MISAKYTCEVCGVFSSAESAECQSHEEACREVRDHFHTVIEEVLNRLGAREDLSILSHSYTAGLFSDDFGLSYEPSVSLSMKVLVAGEEVVIYLDNDLSNSRFDLQDAFESSDSVLQKVEMQLLPYSPIIDGVLMDCGDGDREYYLDDVCLDEYFHRFAGRRIRVTILD